LNLLIIFFENKDNGSQMLI